MADPKKPGQPLVKGAALLGFIKHIKSQSMGKEMLEKVIAALPEESREVCKRRVVAVAEYPYSVFYSFIRTADQTLGRGDFAYCKELGRATATRDIQGLGQLFQRKAKTEDLFRAGDVYWKSYHINSGYWKVEDLNPDKTVVRIYEFPTMDTAHCRLMEGWMTQALTETGVQVFGEIKEFQCMSKGAPYHEFAGSWKALK
jgi:hypothetical protein